MKRLEIFRAGRQTAASGEAIDFGEAELQAAVNAYDPAKHEAPIVVGHPRDNAPAYGWIKQLDYSDGTLNAEAGQVNEDFAEMVKSGAFKKRSASFYRPDSPANPVPGTYYLRHVGFLGAQPPAVKGLADPEFKDTAADVVEFADTTAVASLFRRLREMVVDKFGLETADSTLPGFLIEDLEAEARASESEPEGAAFSEAQGQPSTPPTEQEADDMTQQNREAEFAEREQALAERERQIARAEIGQRIDKLIDEGRVLPAHRDRLVDFAAALDDSDEIEFGEGDAQVKATRRAFLDQFLAELPKAVQYGEHGAPDDDPTEGATEREVAERAIQYRERLAHQGNHITTTQAVQAVRAGKDQ